MDGFVAVHGSVICRTSRLTVEIPEEPGGWFSGVHLDQGHPEHVTAWASWSSGDPRPFEGSFVISLSYLAANLAARGSAVLGFRLGRWWVILPVYVGSLPAAPLGHCFTFVPRRVQPLCLEKEWQMDSALTCESSLLPRRAGGRWARRDEATESRTNYATLLSRWGRKAYAAAWILPMASDPDEPQVPLVPYE